MQEPCVKYESNFEPTNLTTVKIDETDAAGNTRSKKFPQWMPKHGVEGLFHVIDHFNENGRKLGFVVADHWNNFDEILETVSEAKWDNQIAGIANDQCTDPQFEREMSWKIQISHD